MQPLLLLSSKLKIITKKPRFVVDLLRKIHKQKRNFALFNQLDVNFLFYKTI